MDKGMVKELEKNAAKNKVSLWRSHPSFFMVSAYFAMEGLVLGKLFLTDENTTQVYANMFKYVPEEVFGSFFLVGALLILFALISRRHRFLRLGAGIILIPNVMMITNFILLMTAFFTGGLLVATFKWGLTCLMLLEMMFEPFVNPNSAR